MIDNEKDPTKIVSMTRFEYQMELDKAKLEQKAIDDAELHQRFEKVLNGQKWDLIDRACEWLLSEGGLSLFYQGDEKIDRDFVEVFRKAIEE